MSVIHLVRHGQASFGSHDYDRLSLRGIRQVQRLQEHWSAVGEQPSVLHCGPLRRQRQTAELLAEITGVPIIENAAFKEFSATQVLDAHALAVGLNLDAPDAPPSLELPKDHPAVEEPPNSDTRRDPEQLRRFQQRLEAATLAWVRGELSGEFESWAQFQGRVVQAMDDTLTGAGRRQNIVICTSAGVIAAALGQLLGLQGEATIRLSWVLLNASISSVLFDGRRRTLLRFNALPHLEQPAYRDLLTRI